MGNPRDIYRGHNNLIHTNGIVPTSPQKSFPCRRRYGCHELTFLEVDDSGSDASEPGSSPRMPPRNNNAYTTAAASHAPRNNHHQKVTRSQSEPKGPNFLEFSHNNNPFGQQQQQMQNQHQNRFKTELCRSFQENGSCKYGEKCQFAHGEQELRNVQRHAKYKTERCVNFHATGLCAYGKRCHFIHHPDEDQNARRTSVSIPEEKVLTRSQSAYCAPVRGRAVSLSSFPPANNIPVMLTNNPSNYIADQALNLDSCGNSFTTLSTSSYSSSPECMSPGINACGRAFSEFTVNRDLFGSSSSSEVFHDSEEETNEAPGPWTRALEHLLLDIDYY